MESGEDPPPALPPKPKPKLAIPTILIPSTKSPSTATIGPALTAGCAVPIGNVNGPFGIFQTMYQNKATEYMFRQYEGVKDFTCNTAKAGLSFGEKWSFWFYGRVRSLSRKWFTHIFLLLVVILYSMLGALLFVTVEGSQEERERVEIEESFREVALKVRKMANDGPMLVNYTAWQFELSDVLKPYRAKLEESWAHGVTLNPVKRWTFWNSVFYCGTIYTTIVGLVLSEPSNMRNFPQIAL